MKLSAVSATSRNPACFNLSFVTVRSSTSAAFFAMPEVPSARLPAQKLASHVQWHVVLTCGRTCDAYARPSMDWSLGSYELVGAQLRPVADVVVDAAQIRS